MITVQKITFEMENQNLETIIEEIGYNRYRVVLPPNFLNLPIHNPTTAGNTLISILKNTFIANNKIQGINNQVSDLLDTNTIKRITGCNNITES